MPVNVKDSDPKGGSDLFIVDNSDEEWKVVRYLREWAQSQPSTMSVYH